VIKRRQSFDPKSFLAKVGEGRSIGRYRKDQIIIDYNGGMEVHSSLLNVVLHDQPQIKT